MQDKTILTEETSSGKGQLLATFDKSNVMWCPFAEIRMKTRLFKAAKKYALYCENSPHRGILSLLYLHCYVSIRSGTMYWCSHKTHNVLMFSKKSQWNFWMFKKRSRKVSKYFKRDKQSKHLNHCHTHFYWYVAMKIIQ
jgi:hypothetical protein